jgi:hypothetical protein
MSKFNINQATSKTGEFIVTNKKPLLYIGGAIAVTILAVAVVRRLKGKIEGRDISKGKFVEQDIDLTKTTISVQTAKNYAEILFEAFNYDWGTDKSQVESVFSRIKPEDFKLVYNAYGKRDYGTLTGLSPTWAERAGGLYRSLDLVQWINEELEIGDSALREKIRKVIEPAGFVIER